MTKTSKDEICEQRFAQEYERATRVHSDIELKTAIRQKKLVIISSNEELYGRLLKKLPKENISAGSKKLGGFLLVFGTVITIATAGLFSFVGIPLAGAGAALGATGMVLDDYKDYSLLVNYEKKEVVFIKTKGNPCLELPKGANKKLNR